MNNYLAFGVVAVMSLLSSAHAATTFYLFKASATLSLSQVVVQNMEPVDKFVSKTLVGNDLINLAMGRPLGTKVDPKAEMLVLAVTVEGPGAVVAPLTKVLVINPDPAVTGSAKMLATVFTLSALNFDALAAGTKSTGQGIGTVRVTETTTGVDPTNNKFFSTTLDGGGVASTPLPTVGQNIDAFKFTLKSLSGPMHVRFTTTKSATPVDLDGVVVKAMFSVSAKGFASVDL